MDSRFRSEFYDEPIAPLIFLTHQLKHFLCQLGLVIRIDDAAESHVLVAVHLERDSRVVPDVLHPVSLVTVLRNEIESSLMSDVPDLNSVGCLSLPAFSSEVEELMFVIFQQAIPPRNSANCYFFCLSGT